MTGEHGERSGARTRRSVLKTTAASIVTGALGATAGCLATLPPLGQRVSFGRVDAPAGDEATYATWVPDADALGDGTRLSESTDVMDVTYATPAALQGTVLGQKGTFPATYLKSRVDYFGHGFDAYDVVLGYGPVVALAGDVDRDLAGRTATDSGYVRATTYEGYDVYEREDVPRAAFVGDDVVAWAQGSTARADVQAVLDARDGRIRRRYDRDEAFATTVDETGAHPYTWVYETGSGAVESAFPAATHVGLGTTTDGDGVYFVLTFRFGDGDVPSLGEARDALESNDRALDSEATDVSVGDAVVRAEIRMPVDEYDERVSAGVGEWPQVTWGASRDDDAVRIRHEAGDPVGADWLTASLSPSVESPPTLFESGTVGPGDVAAVDRSELPADTKQLRLEASPPGSQNSGLVFSVPLADEDA